MSLDLITAWHRNELGMPIDMPLPRLIAGFPLWGEKYARWFANFGLSSLMAPTNRRALEQSRSMFVVYIDEEAQSVLVDESELPDFLVLRRLPESIVEMVRQTPQLKYPLMTAVHSLLMREAGMIGAGFSMSVGDLVYSEDYILNLLRMAERYDAVSHIGLSADRERLGDLRKWRGLKYNSLRLSAGEMGRLVYDNMLASWRSWSMEDNKDFTSMPSSHLIHWRARDHIRLHCPHMGPMWLSSDRCRAAGVLPILNGGIDAEQSRFMGGNCYIPGLKDDVMLMTLNDPMPPCDRLPFDAFRQHLFGVLGFDKASLPYFMAPCRMPADDGVEPFQDDDVIEAEWQELVTRLGLTT